MDNAITRVAFATENTISDPTKDPIIVVESLDIR